ncbi:hypothetical protein M5Y49_18325 [Escherichia coli]|nr:hypothetical protein [Escherichia coli]
MATNNFKPFATGAGANVTPQADYEALTALLTGFQSGKASSAQVNKAIRQATFVAAALAQYMTNKTGQDVLDNGDINAFITKMAAAFGHDFQALDAGLTSLAGLVGAADTLPYFTGLDTFSLTSLTSVGRNLISQSSIANALFYLQGAPINSPSFTGTPFAPTAAAGTNNTQIATTQFAQSLITALLDGAPTALNTLNKIASAINNDPIYAANVNAALNLKAPLASPALTGTPTAPTAAGTTNNTQIATTAFAQALITALIGGAPTGLNTLNKIATAINNDPSFAANVVAALALKAPLASPALTGSPTAPTATAGDNSTLLATTAFVTAALTAFLPKRSFGLNDFIRIPDVPGGLILQWGTTAGTGSDGLITATLPTPFPNNNGICAVCAYYSGSRNAIATQVASITQTTIQLFASVSSTGAAAASAQIRYFVLGY